ncbi:LtfC-like domain-containing protein [Nocardia fluminea]|uniref:LtfC-like domain-containing protein n=1 Tax=Nocardia fluminea TaxID=134984 RepID=UPI003669023A
MPIGWRPIQDNIDLSNGDFIVERTHPGGPLPPGTTAEIIWDISPTPITWTATVEDAVVSWLVQQADVALIPAGTPFTMWIHYPNAETSGTDDYEWTRGVARR